MRRLALPLALLAVWAGTGAAEPIYRGSVSDARLALDARAQPLVAYVADGALWLATRQSGAWGSAPLFILPSRDVELDGLVAARNRRVSILVRGRDARWLALVTQNGSGGWRWQAITPDARRDRIGPAGLTLDAQDRPVVAYALWHPSQKTALRLVRADAGGRLRTSGITRKGFPPTPTLAAAAPVLMPSGEIHVVETYAPAAIEWSPIPGDWTGQFLHSSALGVPTGVVAVAASGLTVYAAWTETYPTLGPPAVVLAVHADVGGSSVAIENAVFAGLALTPTGPELAANRCLEASCIGLVGGAGVDGVVAGFAVDPGGAREFLVADDGGLAWYRAPAALPLHVTLAKDLTGRVGGTDGGVVTLYRESAAGSRTAVGTFPVAADGSFAASDPTSGAAAAVHRVVYVDPATSIPYAALAAPSG